PSVVPALIRAMEHADAQDCDWVMSEIPAIMGRLGAPARPALTGLLAERSRPPYLRATAAEALAATSLYDSTELHSLFALISSRFADPIEDEDLRGLAGNTLLDFQRSEYKDALLAFAREQEQKHRENRLWPLPFSEEDIEEAFARPQPSLAHYDRDWLEFYSPEAIARRQARWAEEARKRAEHDFTAEDLLEEDLDDLLPPMPVVRSQPKVDRNDPCPCGSGKKYKKCCLDKAAPAPTPALFSEADRASVLNKLRLFAARPEIADDAAQASLDYWGPSLHDRAEEDQRKVLDLQQAEVMRTAWLWFDCELEDGLTLADMFLREEGARLTPGEHAYLDQARATYQGLYEVEEVRLDEGVTLRDLSTDERLWVRERSATHAVARWDLIVARLLSRSDGSRVIEAGLLYISPHDAELLLPKWRKTRDTFRARFPHDSAVTLLKRTGHLLSRWWLTLAAFRPLPTVVTAEGDPMVFMSVVYDVTDRAPLAAALAAAPELEQIEPDVFDWHEPTPRFRRSLGTIRLADDRLTLETTSEARAERGRKMLEALAPHALRYRVTSHQDIKHALERAESRYRAAPVSSLPPDVEAEMRYKFFDEHYQAWVDEPVPALDNLTPRKAARDRRRRPKLIELLKQLENSEEHAAREGRKPYDFSWMWKELGLERP
ncbi:MAG: YecA family protein, partial [Nitrospirales bacterium]